MSGKALAAGQLRCIQSGNLSQRVEYAEKRRVEARYLLVLSAMSHAGRIGRVAHADINHHAIRSFSKRITFVPAAMLSVEAMRRGIAGLFRQTPSTAKKRLRTRPLGRLQFVF
jgi:hypothetical protein